MKRRASFAVVGAIALSYMTVAASAAPIMPNSFSQMDPHIAQVWGGCGWGFHPNRWGHCVPNPKPSSMLARLSKVEGSGTGVGVNPISSTPLKEPTAR